MAKNQRNGQRKPRSIGTRSHTPDLGYYLIVTDTKETEQNTNRFTTSIFRGSN